MKRCGLKEIKMKSKTNLKRSVEKFKSVKDAVKEEANKLLEEKKNGSKPKS